MRINRVRHDVTPRDDVMDLIQDFDAITQKLSATASHQRLSAGWQPPTAPVIYLTPKGDLVPGRQRRAKYVALAKSIVIAGFLVVGAVFGTLIS